MTTVESPNRAYFERREALYRMVCERGPIRTSDLARVLGWTSHEVRGKLVTLKNAGCVIADGYGHWRAASKPTEGTQDA